MKMKYINNKKNAPSLKSKLKTGIKKSYLKTTNINSKRPKKDFLAKFNKILSINNSKSKNQLSKSSQYPILKK